MSELDDAAKKQAAEVTNKPPENEVSTIEADPTPPTPEQAREARIQKIADRHLKEVPETDRRITDPKQVERLLYVIDNTGEAGDLFVTSDKLGNLPMPAGKLLFPPTSATATAEQFVAALRGFALNPVEGSKETDKVKGVATSSLPESVKKALLEIILVDGEKSAVAAFETVATTIEEKIPEAKAGGGSAKDAVVILSELKAKGEIASRSADNERREAALKFMQAAYPQIFQSEEFRFLRETEAESPDSGEETPTSALAFATRVNNLLIEKSFPPDAAKRIGGANTMAELIAKLDNAQITNLEPGTREYKFIDNTRSTLERLLKGQLGKRLAATQ